MTVDDRLGVFLNTGILASHAQDLGAMVALQDGILQDFIAAGFDPTACAAVLRQAIARHPFIAELFDPESVAAGGCIASDALLYQLHRQRDRWRFEITPPRGEPIVLQTSADRLPALGNALRDALQRQHWEPLAALFDEPRLLASHAPAAAAPPLAWPGFHGPGIQRLEHASLLIASETTRLLTDPISLAVGGNVGLPDLERAPSNLAGSIDGMLVTHGHLDHWHLPTLLRHGGDGSVPVIVPDIPVPSLLSQDDMRRSLQELGQNAIAPKWGDTVQIGDIEIDILPFYGEQPTIGAATPPEHVRNWGNCYRVTTPQFSVILLVDSGEDAMGSVMQVIESSVARRGPPDLILSCCREMRKAPFWQGLFTFWMVLPMHELKRLTRAEQAGEGPSITLGPERLAEACVRAGVDAFAPYANGFGGIGEPIRDIGWINDEPSEADMLERIEARLATLDGTTRVIRWLPGDVLRPGRCAALAMPADAGHATHAVPENAS
ncbi:MBL fold metallo-hydrolase [Burkholderia glumae]|uniref:MBL fold metallo-hydrolase n=2 Tax=Burkholderia glumae TaxID=337 RepID=A0AAP9XWY1_BURGL|nr:MBL fold metallo-hydrolase [Burkholderia glumae]ACR31399.1 Metallo-beta-lactamase superfamily protein [Burkholderia glumae BGR1]AJY62653.1 beta-lactamase superfamily domain protein [Burkholderia glumae LMG 2196 = ATCC 33617]KHJ62948.1 Zn-dependent hydrolase [Burkholderia glumae]MCM2485442.1 MBL fold metallo-hydrolase [Burkholderia glumae]MCM2495850.1 MBL fold metallo-hydrolase [Burkholderia glumae]